MLSSMAFPWVQGANAAEEPGSCGDAGVRDVRKVVRAASHMAGLVGESRFAREYGTVKAWWPRSKAGGLLNVLRNDPKSESSSHPA